MAQKTNKKQSKAKKKKQTNKQTNKNSAYLWSLRDVAPATASVSESFQSGMVRGRNEYLR